MEAARNSPENLMRLHPEDLCVVLSFTPRRNLVRPLDQCFLSVDWTLRAVGIGDLHLLLLEAASC